MPVRPNTATKRKEKPEWQLQSFLHYTKTHKNDLNNTFFEIFIYRFTLSTAWIFLLGFLHNSELWLLKVSLRSNLAAKKQLSFSQWLFFISKIFYYSYNNSVVCANELIILAALIFIRLSLKDLNNSVEASFKDLTTSSMLFVLSYGVLTLT